MSGAARVRRYRRSQFLVISWLRDELVLLNSNTLQRFQVHQGLLALLSRLSEWSRVEEVSTPDDPVKSEDLDELHRLGILEMDDGNVPDPRTGFEWDPLDLVVQRRTEQTVSHQLACGPAPRLRKNLSGSRITKLPPPAQVLPQRLSEVLNQRRTIRTYLERPLPLEKLSTLLYHSARTIRFIVHPQLGEMALRPYPTAGARSELEVYVVSEDIEGCETGAFYYEPDYQYLIQIRDRDEQQARILRAVHDASGGMLNGNPPAILLITAVFERVMWKYRDIGLSLIYKDTGCLLQTLYLVATALGLAPCAIGGGTPETSRWLGLDPLSESQVGCFLIGYPVRGISIES